MIKAVTIILVSLTTTLALSQNKKQYQYNDNIPTRFGIRNYIDLNIRNIVHSVENFIGDSILTYTIKVDNLSEYQDYDSLEAGRFYPEDEIIITDEPNFYDYELSLVPKWKQKGFDNNTKFVRGILIHELIHLYIYQFIRDCLDNDIPINSEYINFKVFPSITSYYTPEFIEEGICEYVVMKLKEGIFGNYKVECPEGDSEIAVKELRQLQTTYGIKYQYSRIYMQRILEKNNFKKALLVIFTSKPPSYEELLCPDRYYSRLLKQAEDMDIHDFSI